MPNGTPEGRMPRRPLAVVGGGGALGSEVVLEAVMSGTWWPTLINQVDPRHEVPVRIGPLCSPANSRKAATRSASR